MFAAFTPLLAAASATPDPHPGMIIPFALLLAAIATGPFINKHWWEHHYHHVALGLGAITTLYYVLGLGAGVRIVSDRKDVHARTFATIAGEDFSVVRLHAQWRLAPRWQLRGRIENALNERYEEIHGFPQPPWGAFVGWEREW